jgi:hypothetical protein
MAQARGVVDRVLQIYVRVDLLCECMTAMGRRTELVRRESGRDGVWRRGKHAVMLRGW